MAWCPTRDLVMTNETMPATRKEIPTGSNVMCTAMHWMPKPPFKPLHIPSSALVLETMASKTRDSTVSNKT